jgi:hypothetical protein
LEVPVSERQPILPGVPTPVNYGLVSEAYLIASALKALTVMLRADLDNEESGHVCHFLEDVLRDLATRAGVVAERLDLMEIAARDVGRVGQRDATPVAQLGAA